MELDGIVDATQGVGTPRGSRRPAPNGRGQDICDCNAEARLPISSEPVDRLTFWRNWYLASRQLPDELRLAWLDAVLDFAFEGREPKPAGSGNVADAIGFQAVAMVRATIEISRKRKEIGSKGGSAKSKGEAKRKQRRSKAQANPNQVQEQEQEQEHNANSITATARGRLQPTVEQFVDAGKLAGVPEDFARPFYAELVAAGWQDADGVYVGNWRRYLKSAYLDEQKKISAARQGVAVDDIPMAR